MDYSEFNEMFNSSSSSTDMQAVFAVLGVFFVIFMIICIFAIIFKIVARWIFFKKCGKEGWRALIPFYTDFTLVEIAGLNWWWILIIYASSILSAFQSSFSILEESDSFEVVAPLVLMVGLLSFVAAIANLIAKIGQSYNIAKRFNKGIGYVVLLVLFEPIMLLILGISKSAEYDSSIEVSPNGLFGMKTTKESIYCSDCGTKVNGDFCPSCGKKMR